MPATRAIDYYRQLVNHATQWARTGKVNASLNLQTYLTRVVPKTRDIDRGFWLGEVLEAIRRSAASELSSEHQRDLDRMIALATASSSPAAAKKSPKQEAKGLDDLAKRETRRLKTWKPKS